MNGKMPRSLHNAWIAALREPGRRQGRNKLNCNGAQCCLDVLCEVAGASLENGVRTYGGDLSSSVVPAALAKEFGIDPSGISRNDFEDASLAELNDDYGWTFLDIAAELENNPGKYYSIEED